MAKKRSSGEGSVRKMRSGRWRGELMDGYTPDGKKNMVYFSGDKKGDVLEQIRNYVNLRDANVRVNQLLVLSEWAQNWYDDYKSQVQPSTYSGYKYTLKLITTHLGSLKVKDLLPIHVNSFMDTLSDLDYSRSQIQKCRAMLIQILDAAESNNLISRNPARMAKKLRNIDEDWEDSTKDAFTEEEINLLDEYLPNDLLGNSIRLMLYTGIRVQELLALTPASISEDGSVLRIDQAIKTVNGVPVLGPPKSKRSKRTVPIPAAYRNCAMFLRSNGGKELIWTKTLKQSLYSVGSFRRRYYTALSKIPGVRKLSPHCCRHTYVTRLEARNVPMEIIARLAGHSEIKTTDRYLHTSAEMLENAVSVLNEGKE